MKAGDAFSFPPILNPVLSVRLVFKESLGSIVRFLGTVCPLWITEGELLLSELTGQPWQTLAHTRRLSSSFLPGEVYAQAERGLVSSRPLGTRHAARRPCLVPPVRSTGGAA